MKYDTTVGNVNIKLSTDRFDKNFIRAQKKLDQLVLGDSTKYVPHQGGYLRDRGHIIQDGLIEWDAPYSHYMYMGELYLAENGSSYARKYEKKHPTGIELNYHEGGTGSHWFERAKETHGQEWIKTVKRIGGGG